MTSPSDVRLVDLAGAPPIPGMRARVLRDDADYDQLSRLMSAANTYDGLPWLPTADNVRLEFQTEGIDLASDVVLVEVGGRVIAMGKVDRVVREGLPIYEVWGAVLPSFRRRGLGTSLLAWNMRRARARALDEPAGTSVSIGSFAEEVELGTRAILASAGFEPVRHFFLMHRDHLDDIPDTPLPEGLEIRPVSPDQHRVIAEAEHEAFLDHWGQREWSEDHFQTTFARSELDTGLWVVAWDGDQVAGVVQNWIWAEENERLGVRRGWLERITVRRPWRRRGLGRALTAASLVRLREAGFDEAMLGVDADNAQGALHLYEDLGFTVHSRAAAYRRDL